MKTFITFIKESKSATLYHSTDMESLHKILKSGKIKASRNGEVSTTRDKDLHYNRGDAQIHLDQEKISHNQKITPTDWHSNKGGSVKKDKSQDEDDRDEGRRREESEESIKGHVSLKHAHTLSVHKDEMKRMSRPKDEHEEHIEKHPHDPENWMRPATATSYSERKKKFDAFKKLVAKHKLKLVTHG
jgi:hypothetical protein